MVALCVNPAAGTVCGNHKIACKILKPVFFLLQNSVNPTIQRILQTHVKLILHLPDSKTYSHCVKCTSSKYGNKCFHEIKIMFLWIQQTREQLKHSHISLIFPYRQTFHQFYVTSNSSTKKVLVKKAWLVALTSRAIFLCSVWDNFHGVCVYMVHQ